jgi:ADP-heptose:LPS heptosyltransferase
MRCSFCSRNVESFHEDDKHIIIAKNKDEHIHVHGDYGNKDETKDMFDVAAQEIGISLGQQVIDKKEIVFHNRQRIGDMLMFTCAVRDLKAAFPDLRINVDSTACHIWDYNPNIDRSLKKTDENLIKIGPSKLTNASNRLDWHFANAYRMSMEDALGVSIPQGESRPDIWLSEEEYNAPRVFKEPYWIICVNGEKGWGCKMYPFKNWQKVIDQNPDIKFVQIGTNEDKPPRLQGDNVIDHVGKTQSKDEGIRDLYKLFLHAEGSIGLVSFHMHLSGALYKPCVVVAGAREPVSFTRYAGHQYLANDGCLPCGITACWHCDIKTCTNLIEKEEEKIPKCVDIIEPEDVTRAIRAYYKGGRLRLDKCSDKLPKKSGTRIGVNVVSAPPRSCSDPSKTYNTHGLAFGSPCISEKDWVAMQEIIEKHKIKTVLEFGCGLSTLMMLDAGLKVTSLETQDRWKEDVAKKHKDTNILLWDGVKEDVIKEDQKFDMAFIDGPQGGDKREISTKLASKHASVIIQEDSSREQEVSWSKKYLEGKFWGPFPAGERSRLWLKRPSDNILEPEPESPESPKPEPEPEPSKPELESEPKSTINSDGKKFVKIVSTARGWGGCARSVTTIMRLLLQAGHSVEFIPFRNKVGSKEFREILEGELKDVIVTEHYGTLSERCDAMLVYADDYVWEFKQQEIVDSFKDLNADRKIMMLNFRRGPVGEAEWTKGWDKYMFLNSSQEKELLKVLPDIETKVLPPCTDLSYFFDVEPNYDDGIRIVRHSSQGDVKFADMKNPESVKEASDLIKSALTRDDLKISMLPGPSFIKESDRFYKVQRTADPSVIADFLKWGNLFWYSLPEGYMDMGPRVILEAMAAGLPVIADNWGGAVDRVTPECGWICDTKEEQVQIIKNVTLEELKKKGSAARERAKEFIADNWVKELVG